MKPTRIIIIAKEPKAGLAKTRMIPGLGAEGAAVWPNGCCIMPSTRRAVRIWARWNSA